MELSFLRAWWITLPLICAVGCSGGDDEALDDDDGDESVDSTESAVSVPGRWTLPANVRAIGAKVRVGYDDAPAWRGGSGCAGGLKAGARELRTFLDQKFGAITSIGGYACRPNTANTSKTSVHGTGRALDVMIPKSRGSADNTKGDAVAHWLIEHAQEIGVQLIIWDRSIWRANGRNEGAYGGPHPHDDHLHVEITDEAAAKQTAWFKQ